MGINEDQSGEFYTEVWMLTNTKRRVHTDLNAADAQAAKWRPLWVQFSFSSLLINNLLPPQTAVPFFCFLACFNYNVSISLWVDFILKFSPTPRVWFLTRPWGLCGIQPNFLLA